ncbi:hypothetical protein BS35_002877 [Actinomadura glauciflava]|nr:hypothetical protein [Actinomadura glauciflava]
MPSLAESQASLLPCLETATPLAQGPPTVTGSVTVRTILSRTRAFQIIGWT